MNLWHEISPGENVPEKVNVIVEIPKGSHNKYEIDKETGLIKMDRANYSDAAYPVEYGFVPQTLWDDGDALDTIILATYPIASGILVTGRPVGLMKMIDGGESDDKLICVPDGDIRWDDVRDINDINKHTLREIQHFFENVKKLKAKPVVTEVNGFVGKTEAMDAVRAGIELYKQKFQK
ncbi:MAG TPA: inorganic diphosphatase [Candidatus Paceibacterota bacterium]